MIQSKSEKDKKESVSSQTIKGTLWNYISRYSGKLLVFISTIILARLLSEDDFGVAGYALVFMSFLEVLRPMGIGAALIFFPEKEENNETAFWLFIIIGFALFTISWIFAPFVGTYFNDDRAIIVVRLISLSFPINALGSVQDSLLTKHLDFNLRFIPDFARAVVKGLISIALATAGFGAASLVWGHLAGAAIAVVALWIVSPWRPSLKFSVKPAQLLLAYGVKIISIDLLSVVLNNLDYLIIGRYFSASMLGVYTIAFRLPEIIIKQFYSLAGQVFFPAYSKLKSKIETLKASFLLTVKYINLITIPIWIGLSFVSKPFVLVFLTAKWEEAIPLIPIISLSMILRAIGFNAGSIYKATGHPNIIIKIKIIQLAATVPILWQATNQFGTLSAIAWGMVLSSVLELALNLYYIDKILGVRLSAIATATLPGMASGGIMAATLGILTYFIQPLSSLSQLALMVVTGAFTYVLSVYILFPDIYIFLKDVFIKLLPAGYLSKS
ncbi:MAG: O-antigen/teichoic acid export membrane protein [Cellvibrionaceae bacterium]|jgi:O-antigen/teichoic acid export membrane protein